MKATPMTQRPSFSLLKQTDIQAFYHLQMPRWLFSDSRYLTLSLEAKVTYSFLLNRFQLSKLNDWINDNGEVFIIYTRESLSEEMQISYRKVIDCMKALAAAQLIYERRCGRGDGIRELPNRRSRQSKSRHGQNRSPRNHLVRRTPRRR